MRGLRERTTRRDGVGTASLFVCAVLPLAVPGCASSGSDQTGVRIGNLTLEQFKVGVTTESWLVGILGPPSSWSSIEGIENTKVFRYSTDEGSSGLGSIFTGQSNRNLSVVYFIITDGIVTRYWADRAVERTILGGASSAPASVTKESHSK